MALIFVSDALRVRNVLKYQFRSLLKTSCADWLVCLLIYPYPLPSRLSIRLAL